MSANVDLYLYDSNSQALRASRKSGTEAETIDTAQPPGTYYVVVRNTTTQKTSYYLTVDVRPVAPNCHVELAHNLDLDLSPSTFRTSVGDDCGHRWATFKVDKATAAKIDLELTRSDGDTAVMLFLKHLDNASAGVKTPLQMAQIGVGARHKAERLLPGTYYVQLNRMQGTNAEVRVAVSTTTGTFDPEPPGSVVREFNDWTVRLAILNTQKRCHVYTIAKSVSPDDWRVERPHLLLSLWPKAPTTVGHSFDSASFYDRTSPLRATIRTGSNAFPVPVSIEQNASDVQTMEACASSKSGRCVSNKGLQGLTKGYSLVLEGLTADKRASTITYSLMGYQAAITHAASLCDNPGIVPNLIKP